VPRSRVLFDRYVKRSVYVVLTASIVPSVIWLASLDRSTSNVQTLLESPAQQSEITIQSREAEQDGAAELREATVSEAGPPYPVKASMTPSYSLATAVAELAEPAAAEDVVESSPDEAFITLGFRQDSWFEVLASDGRRIESGILRAGEERRFSRSQVGKVSIGNAGGVEVSLDGEQLDLTPFRRANVARFALSSAGSVSPIEG
jgi:cytoskeleton protein RodZ